MKIENKNPDPVPCGEERARLDLGAFYVQLSSTLWETFRNSVLNHVIYSVDGSDLFEALCVIA